MNYSLFGLLLSGNVSVSTAEKSGSSPLVLILVIIILVLIAVLLIRDKKIRGKVVGFFKFIGRKIKNARIKSRIEKEEKELSGLITKLGMKGFDNKIFPEGSDELVESIRAERATIEKFDQALAGTERKIEDMKSEHEIFISLKASEIEKEEKLKEPVEKKYKELSGKISGMKKESEDNEKRLSKIAKGMEKALAELEKLKKDALLDPEERESRKTREENTLSELEKESAEIKTRSAALPAELTLLEKEAEGVRSRMDVFEKKIDKLKKEHKDAETKHKNGLAELVKEKGHITGEKAKTNETLSGHYEALGKMYDKMRPENNDLSVVYIDIDRARVRIKDLRSQLT